MSSSDLTDDEEPQTWIEWFCQLRGHEFFCEIDTQYIGETLLVACPRVSACSPRLRLFS